MNKTISDNFEYFAKNHKDIYDAYKEFGQKIHNMEGGLDSKCIALIKVAISASAGKMYALETHIKKALDEGCDSKQIEQVLLLIAPTAGFPTMMEALLVFRRVVNE